MPELPEVETIRRQLEPKLIDAAIVDAGAHWSAKFTPALDAIGTEIVSARRRG
ncbi:MAG: DNA-formamidopyrimidine glycosylase, partial [Actinobacteria bacterium]|nr:DNA-formamidopyrimidine glycosylase [Actinomycetota bacterium]